MTDPQDTGCERVGFVGSRGFKDMELVRERVRRLRPGDVVVSGGARGVDSVAEQEAARLGLATSIHRVTPDQWRESKLAGKNRNWPLAWDCTRLEAFWDGTSNGTAHCIAAAVRALRPVEIWMEGDS